MKLLSSFAKKAPNRVFISIVLGALAGICYAGLIPLVLSSIRLEDPAFTSVNHQVDTFWSVDVANYKLALLYLAACVLIMIMRSLSEIILVRVASEVAKDLRTDFYRQISTAPLAVLEKMGSSTFIASINLDVPRIIMGARVMPVLLINGITLVCMLSFLMYLNPDVFRLVIVAMVVGIVCYQLPMMVGSKIFQRSRETQDELQKSIKGLIYGAKELKLDSFKRRVYFKEALISQEDSILKNDKAAQTIVRATISFGDLISFFVIGSVSFIFINYYPVKAEELIGVVMALLYVTGPIALLLNAMPQLAISQVSWRKFNRLLSNIPAEDINFNLIELSPWESLRFEAVEYRYPSASDEEGFHVGPLTLEIKKGDVTFIIGANGSGKSTLSKLLTLHYLPSHGAVYFGDTLLSKDTIASYRQNIGAIYSDYHLFDRLLIEQTDEVQAVILHYLEKFHLAEKVTIKDGYFSTLSLSDGQRKRLALLVSFLEDKDLYLFDEWAADQDPMFKSIFYNEILPELKAKGKAVIVISHDDRYFDTADNILVMEQGKLVEYKPTTMAQLEQSN
jgi:putative ATP-binding cassette transporter